MRSNYWSCGDFADWIRGTKYPECESSEGWDSIQKLAKATHPLRFWIAEELLDKLQDIVMFPSDTFYNIKYYVENRWVSRTHSLTAHPKDIKPGDWCDVGYRFLPCMFNELVDFVEVELAWSFIRWGDKAQYEKYNVPNFHWRSWRCKQAGLDYLDWASELVYENKDKTHYDLSPQALAAIDSVKLSHLSQRLPHQLSGGQRQRIALARALVLRPKVLLLDEPLGALDKQLREEMQVELKRIQREAGITFIFVTHDQEEAMRMSDRIAVFNEGSIEQVGTPAEVYERPQTKFVASFLGVSNIFSGDDAKAIFGNSTMVNIRPERIKLVPADTKLKAGESGVVGSIIEASYIGATTIYLIQTESGQRVIATRLNEELPDQINRFETGDRVGAVWKSDHSAVIPT